ncbi:unnamed protein product [Nesidiocoris tenuis]|uniref:Uncharacterized protein n=1 Tax=Nesidiocoris tenuis TaxID=355587 RepID=A0A6H5HM95_9HEMI|nr:unnamed protein product [Nesidiocoris tenuis]
MRSSDLVNFGSQDVLFDDVMALAISQRLLEILIKVHFHISRSTSRARARTC